MGNEPDVGWPYAMWPYTDDLNGLKTIFKEIVVDPRYVVVLTDRQCAVLLEALEK